MSFRVNIEAPARDVPQRTRQQVEKQLAKVADQIDCVDRKSPLWSSLEKSSLFLDLDGWRFSYRVDCGSQTVIVETISKQ